MRELLGNTCNIALIETKTGKLEATVEVVLLVSEVRYRPDASGMVKTRDVQDLRFAANVAALMRMAKWFAEMADEAAELESRATLSKAAAHDA